jgi:hypothetical protein
MPSGVVDGFGVDGHSKPKSITTEGRSGPITSLRGRNENMNSGESGRPSSKNKV